MTESRVSISWSTKKNDLHPRTDNILHFDFTEDLESFFRAILHDSERVEHTQLHTHTHEMRDNLVRKRSDNDVDMSWRIIL